jgi:ABC-type polysaccharide/polyol phosphate transport system ATPase subunit
MNNIAINVEELTKVFKLYDKPVDRLKESVLPFGKQYHKDFYALRDVSLQIKSGESIGIIGKNGSGKSTLLKILSSVLTPTSGKVEVNGNVSALLELGAGFNPQMTGIKNIYFNGTLLGYTHEQMDAKLDNILAFADIGDYVYQPVKSYSSGMFMRLAFALKTAVDPDILIVDEALAVGDINFRQKCYDRLEDMRAKGLTWILVSHDVQVIKNYCDRCFYLKSGHIEMEGKPEVVTERYLKDSFEERQKTVGASEKLEWREDTDKTSFGTGKAKILSTRIGKNGEETEVFNYGDTIDIEVNAFADRSVLDPDIIIQIRDNRGYIIYGVRSSDLTLVEGSQKTGDRDLKAVFSFEAILSPGNYSIALSLNDCHVKAAPIIHEKVAGALSFTVSEGNRPFHGAVNLNANCLLECETIKNPGNINNSTF